MAASGPSTERTKVQIVFRRGRTDLLQRVRKNQSPDDMLYGLERLNPEHFDTGFVEDDQKQSLFRTLWYQYEKRVAATCGVGFAYPMIRKSLNRLREADVIVSTVDSPGLPLAWLKHRRKLDTPLIYISQGLTDRMDRLAERDPNAHRVYAERYRTYLRAADRLAVLGEGARQPLADFAGVPAEEVELLPFGVDTDFWSPAAETMRPGPDEKILSVGSDPSRDYATLLAATQSMPMRIVSRIDLRPLDPGTHVDVNPNYSDTELRDQYRRAVCVVMPLQDVVQPTGQSATLQAMACGKAVVLSNIRGLWEPDLLKDGENCVLVSPANPEAMRVAIQGLIDQPSEALRIGENARRMVEQHCTSHHFALRIEACIQAVLAKQ